MFFVNVDLVIHSQQYVNTCMAVLIRRVKFFFFLGIQKSFKLRNLSSKTLTLFPSQWSSCPSLKCDQVSNLLNEFSG